MSGAADEVVVGNDEIFIPTDEEIPFDDIPATPALDHAREVDQLETPLPEGAESPEPTPEVQAHLPVDLDHLLIQHIITVSSGEQFIQMFADFENQVERSIKPLIKLLDKVILTSEIQQTETHAAMVDAFRNRITRFTALATAFVEHGKSHRLCLQKAKGVTDFDREAYKKTLTAGYFGFQRRLEGLIDDIDSRVNLCKKYGDREQAGFKNHGGLVNGRTN